jgi:hypothetical protein
VRNKYVLGFILVISLVLYFVLKFFPKMADQASHRQCTFVSPSIFQNLPLQPGGMNWCTTLSSAFCLRPTAKLSAEGLESTF